MTVFVPVLNSGIIYIHLSTMRGSILNSHSKSSKVMIFFLLLQLESHLNTNLLLANRFNNRYQLPQRSAVKGVMPFNSLHYQFQLIAAQLLYSEIDPN